MIPYLTPNLYFQITIITKTRVELADSVRIGWGKQVTERGLPGSLLCHQSPQNGGDKAAGPLLLRPNLSQRYEGGRISVATGVGRMPVYLGS